MKQIRVKEEAKKQELIKARKTKKEAKRQEIRKYFEQSTRLLDNYFDPKVNQTVWRPNGLVKNKQPYTYNKDTGLGFNYNHSRLIKSDNKGTGAKITQQHFLEFDYMENNEVIVTIEHCNNCEEHLSHTNHINNIYHHFSKILQRVIMLRFPFINTYLKPIATHKSSYTPLKGDDTDVNTREVRLGAMEIQYASKITDKVEVVLLHSKLQSGHWPSVYNILNRIQTLVPLIHIRCVVYDKEEGLVEGNGNNRVDNILPTSIENIKVNVYLAHNELIEGFSVEAMDELDIINDPRRRCYAYYEQIEKDKQDLLENNSKAKPSQSSFISKSNDKSFFSKSSSFRPKSTLTLANSTHKGPLSSSSTNKLTALETLNDADTINKLKGKLLSSGYTDSSGEITFQNLPYDSYLFEVEASKNFLAGGSLAQFNKILPRTNKDEEIVTVSKYFGLLQQIDSYVEVYIYSNDEVEFDLVNDAKVHLIRVYEGDNSLFPSGGDRLELVENHNIKGRYEIITSPGEVTLEVTKVGYEPVRKAIILRTGENKINIELSNN